jgi:hypothetical protein
MKGAAIGVYGLRRYHEVVEEEGLCVISNLYDDFVAAKFAEFGDEIEMVEHD